MSISRRDLYAAGEPFGDSATRVEGHRVIYGGGGSKSSGTPYYKQQDKLFGVQADIAQNLYNQYAAYSSQPLNGMSSMVDEGNSGALAQRYRQTAASDSAAASSMERAATERSMASMGVNPNDPRFAGSMRATALGGAANQANAMNQAGRQADEMSWARNQDFYNSLAGMPSQSASMLASSGQGFGQMANAQQSNQNANMAGYGQFGGMIAGGMFKRDGGYINAPKYALGGSVGGGVTHQMPQLGDWRQRGSGFKADKMSTMDKVGAIAQPILMQGAAHYAGEAIKPMMGRAAESVGKSIGSAIGKATPGMTQAAAPVANAVIAPTAQALSAGTTVGGTAGGLSSVAPGVSTAVQGAASGLGAGVGNAVVGTAAPATGGAMAALGTAMPWIGGAMAIGSLLDLWADGGPVPHEPQRGLPGRKDMSKGGMTPNVGTETSDEIPAWLSKGEYVVNADAVKQPGVKKKLEKINEKGLKKRYGEAAGKQKAKAQKGAR